MKGLGAYVAHTLLLLWIRIVASMTIDEAVSSVTSSGSSKKHYLEAIQKLEGTTPSELDPRLAKVLGRAHFFGRRHVMKPDYKKAFQYLSPLKDADSLYMISLCYSQGLGVSRSTEMVPPTSHCFR